MCGRPPAARALSRVPARTRDGYRKRPLLWLLSGLLSVFLLATVVLFAEYATGNYDRRLLTWITLGAQTALGEEKFGSPNPKEGWLTVLGTLALFGGTFLIAVLTSQLSAIATKARVDPEAGARRLAENFRRHVVVAGVGELGYRVARLLRFAKIDCVVVNPDVGDRFAPALESRAPVIPGTIRLEENLERANIVNALGLIACTNDHLSNVEACVRAERIFAEEDRDIRTVARVYRGDWTAEAADGFGVDKSLDAAQAVAPAFAEAATDAAGENHIVLDDLALTATRHRLRAALSRNELADWRRADVRVIAVARQEKARGGLPLVQPAAPFGGLKQGDELLVVGPTEAVAKTLSRG